MPKRVRAASHSPRRSSSPQHSEAASTSSASCFGRRVSRPNSWGGELAEDPILLSQAAAPTQPSFDSGSAAKRGKKGVQASRSKLLAETLSIASSKASVSRQSPVHQVLSHRSPQASTNEPHAQQELPQHPQQWSAMAAAAAFRGARESAASSSSGAATGGKEGSQLSTVASEKSAEKSSGAKSSSGDIRTWLCRGGGASAVSVVGALQDVVVAVDDPSPDKGESCRTSASKLEVEFLLKSLSSCSSKGASEPVRAKQDLVDQDALEASPCNMWRSLEEEESRRLSRRLSAAGSRSSGSTSRPSGAEVTQSKANLASTLCQQMPPRSPQHSLVPAVGCRNPSPSPACGSCISQQASGATLSSTLGRAVAPHLRTCSPPPKGIARSPSSSPPVVRSPVSKGTCPVPLAAHPCHIQPTGEPHQAHQAQQPVWLSRLSGGMKDQLQAANIAADLQKKCLSSTLSRAMAAKLPPASPPRENDCARRSPPQGASAGAIEVTALFTTVPAERSVSCAQSCGYGLIAELLSRGKSEVVDVEELLSREAF